jgi:ABC-type sugar transport system permease subunit
VFLTNLFRDAFIYHNYGYGSAMAVIIFLMTLALTGVVLVIFQRFTYYEGESR